MIRPLFFAMPLCLAILAAIGCDGRPPLANGVGFVRRGAQPLPNVRIELSPLGDAKDAAFAVTDATGRFELRTLDGRPGAMVGKHRVVLEDATGDRAPRVSRANEDDPPAAPVEQRSPTVAERFRYVATSPIEVEVSPEGTNLNIDISVWE
jgi:hypothetical protein